MTGLTCDGHPATFEPEGDPLHHRQVRVGVIERRQDDELRRRRQGIHEQERTGVEQVKASVWIG